MTIGELIVLHCKRTGLTHQRFAELCGVSKGYISQLINERNPTTGRPITPTIETYIKIAEAMQITIDQLFQQIDDVPVALKKKSNDRTDTVKAISDIEYALTGEIHDLSEAEMQDVLDYVRFKRAQKARQETKHDD